MLSSSKNAGYTVIVPKNYRTVGQIMETGQRDVLKKNVKKTLEGMKKFFNEYNEKKMFQKLKNATPDTLRKMMRVIPKVVSIEDDFLNAYGFPLTASFDPNIGIKSIEEDTFARRNPITTGTGLTAAGTAAVLKATGTPIKTALGKAFRSAGTPIAGPIYAGLNIADKIKSGSSVTDAVIDPITGLELSFPGLFKENLKKLTSNPTAQKILGLGYKIPKTAFTVGRALTPVGAGITAAGLAKDYAEFVQRELARKAADPEAYRAEQEEQMGVSAAEGGLIGDKSGPPPISGPTPHGDEGLPAAFKRVKKG